MTKNDVNSRRKKIWEIDHGYLCATIGACLNRAEMRKLAREPEFKNITLQDDHGLHVFFIEVAKNSDSMGKALQRFLDRKYRQATRNYFLSEDSETIAALWKKDLAEGNIDRAWYAVATHPALNLEQASAYYAQLHMISHDLIANFARNRGNFLRQNEQIIALQEQLAAQKQLRKEDKKRFRDLQQEWSRAETLAKKLQRGNDRLREELESLRQGEASRQQAMAGDLRQALLLEQDSLRDELQLARARYDELQEQHLALLQHHEEQHQELVGFENLLRDRFSAIDPCRDCSEQDTSDCPGRNLCGRTVLYVGGLHKMIPHYKQLVETLGGRFLHHDGGKEESRNLLQKMLATADAVFCPIDCVSHDACLSVKKICKRYQKPFVMMRSASLSSLAKGLTDIVQ